MLTLLPMLFNFYSKGVEDSQPCPVCGFAIGAQAGSKEAICTNCGYKDPCFD